jgi:hypothetical protein
MLENKSINLSAQEKEEKNSIERKCERENKSNHN